jgi:hypothetical protein
MTNPDTSASQSAIEDLRPMAGGHHGSASSNLSGRSVLVAWLLSIGVHFVILLIVGNVIFSFASNAAPERPASHAEIIGSVHSTAFVATPPPEMMRRTQVKVRSRVRPTPKKFTKLSELTTTKKPDLSIIGIGAGGGDFSDFGIPMDFSVGAEFFGLGASARGARSIVYVVDRSGSMLDSFHFVQQELRRSISALRRSQKFHVVFFSSGPPLENPPRRLVSAIAAQKHHFFEFLDTILPRGATNPARALQRALLLKPDLVYLLSDGIDFQSNLLSRIDEWNRDRKTRIYTIAYLDRTGSELLEIVAREHNGEFRFVSENDLP